MSGRVVYTSIFGDYDEKQEQRVSGWDWKCFDETNSVKIYSDNNRNAKKFKVLPHRYFGVDYEYSIFIDGNMKVVGNIDELIDKYQEVHYQYKLLYDIELDSSNHRLFLFLKIYLSVFSTYY